MPADSQQAEMRQHVPLLVWVMLAGLVIVACCTGFGPREAPLYGKDCGSVDVMPNGHVRGDAAPAENCLWQAYVHCQAASLTYNWAGTDTGESHHIRIGPSSAQGCLVVDRRTSYSAIGGGYPRLSPVVDCVGIQPSANGLMVKGCSSEGDIGIPLYPAIIGEQCGNISIHQGEVRSEPPGVLQCFWQAYSRCQPANITYYSDTAPVAAIGSQPPVYMMSFQPANGVCVFSLVENHLGGDFVPRTCAELIKQRDRLLVSACGALGDVVLPLSPDSPPL